VEPAKRAKGLLTVSQSFTNLIYHLIFSTKEREPIILPEYQPRLYSYVGGIIRGQRGIPLAINGMEDHLHVLAKLRPDRALSDVLRDLKANATGWMNDVFPELRHFSWQRGYGAFTVSESDVANVSRYIATQKEHHKGLFRDEFISFLRENRIAFDERFV
jgi:REP element-mobilizing transposase RayT